MYEIMKPPIDDNIIEKEDSEMKCCWETQMSQYSTFFYHWSNKEDFFLWLESGAEAKGMRDRTKHHRKNETIALYNPI